MLIRVSAQRMLNGVPKGIRPTMAALAAATPKISTGTVNGRTRTARSKPPRRSATVRDAPIRPMKVSAGVPAASVSATARSPPGRDEKEAEERRGDHERQAGGEPVRQRLGRKRDLERHARHQDQVERAVLVVHRDQAIERQQRGEQRAEPENRRADPRQQHEGRDRWRTG